MVLYCVCRRIIVYSEIDAISGLATEVIRKDVGITVPGGLIVMIKKTVCLVAIAAILVIGAAISQETGETKPTAERHKDRGITCSVCHNGEDAPKSAASPKSCLSCKNHDSWNSVSERTRETKGYKFNPHHNHITETNDLECTTCHRSHNEDTVVCYECHTAMKFK